MRLAAEDSEIDGELLGKFGLPLLGERTGRNDEDTCRVRPHQEFLDEQTRHNRLARAGIVRQHIAQGRKWQHVLVDGGDLVRKRNDVR